MTAIRADDREEILRLRGERLSYEQIAAIMLLSRTTVQAVCREHYGSQVLRARSALAREIAAARKEAASAPLYRFRWSP